MVASNDTIVVDTKTCPNCGSEMVKTHDNDPLGNSIKYKCTDSKCGNYHTIYQ